MAKTRSPFFSLASLGTIGKAVTTQASKGNTIVRAKPTPANPNSLPQQYQRWLYQDYAHLWTQQSIPTQRTYSANGVRHHLTGFQYWMKQRLLYLPFNAAIWHLDTPIKATTPDLSRNTNTGTVFGCTATPGRIDGAFHFDGFNDQVRTDPHPSLHLRDQITIEFNFRRSTLSDAGCMVDRRGPVATSRISYSVIMTSAGAPYFIYRNQAATVYHIYTLSSNVTDLAWHYIAFSFTYGTGISMLAVLDTAIAPGTWTNGNGNDPPVQQPLAPLYIGSHVHNVDWWPGDLDHIFIWNIAQGSPLLIKHGNRSHPGGL